MDLGVLWIDVPHELPCRFPYSSRFSGYSSTTGLTMSSRQERQIIQSCMNLDDFLRTPWKGALF